MKSKHKNEIIFEINERWDFNELFKYIDTIKKSTLIQKYRLRYFERLFIKYIDTWFEIEDYN